MNPEWYKKFDNKSLLNWANDGIGTVGGKIGSGLNTAAGYADNALETVAGAGISAAGKTTEAALGVAGAALYGTARVGLGVGKVGFKAGKALAPYAGKMAGAAGLVGLEGAKTVGNAALGLGKGAFMSAFHGEEMGAIGKIGNVGGVAVNLAKKAFSGLVKVEKGSTSIDKATGKMVRKAPSMKLSGKGWGLVLGASLLAGAKEAWTEENARLMGTVDNKVTGPTPDYQPQEYSKTVNTGNDFAGATGDLVFALHANRGRSLF